MDSKEIFDPSMITGDNSLSLHFHITTERWDEMNLAVLYCWMSTDTVSETVAKMQARGFTSPNEVAGTLYCIGLLMGEGHTMEVSKNMDSIAQLHISWIDHLRRKVKAYMEKTGEPSFETYETYTRMINRLKAKHDNADEDPGDGNKNPFKQGGGFEFPKF